MLRSCGSKYDGFSSALNMSMNRSLVQLEVSPAMRGRIMSIDMMSHGLMPLGLLPISIVAERVSVQAGLAVSGVLLAAITITGAAHANFDTRSRAEQGEIFVPSPQQARLWSLGFDAAVADYYRCGFTPSVGYGRGPRPTARRRASAWNAR